jgi:hypothetical protein
MIRYPGKKSIKANDIRNKSLELIVEHFIDNHTRNIFTGQSLLINYSEFLFEFACIDLQKLQEFYTVIFVNTKLLMPSIFITSFKYMSK